MDSEGKVVRLPPGEVVVATYREIAEHFGLANPEKGRQKAKRAGWPAEPQNHPADPVRVRVPHAAWEGAARSRARAARSRAQGQVKGAPLTAEGEAPHAVSEPPSIADEAPSLIKQLEAAHATLREQLDRADTRARQAEDRANRLERERDAVRAEVVEWTAGGPLARAWRALVYRRARP